MRYTICLLLIISLAGCQKEKPESELSSKDKSSYEAENAGETGEVKAVKIVSVEETPVKTEPVSGEKKTDLSNEKESLPIDLVAAGNEVPHVVSQEILIAGSGGTVSDKNDLSFWGRQVITEDEVKLFLSPEEGSDYYAFPGGSELYLIFSMEDRGLTWYQAASEDLVAGWIPANSVNMNYVQYPSNKRFTEGLDRERTLLSTLSDITRKGPDLRGEGEYASWSLHDKTYVSGAWHLLTDIYHDRYLHVWQPHYEGGSYHIYDKKDGSELVQMFAEPVLSPNKRHFISIGTFYAGSYWFVLASMDGDNFEIIQNEDTGIHIEMNTLTDLFWIDGDKFTGVFTDGTVLNGTFQGQEWDIEWFFPDMEEGF